MIEEWLLKVAPPTEEGNHGNRVNVNTKHESVVGFAYEEELLFEAAAELPTAFHQVTRPGSTC